MRGFRGLSVVGFIGLSCLVVACTDEGEADTTGTGGSDPSTGGAGAGTTEGGGGAASGGGGAGGDGGGAPSSCLAADTFADAFTIESSGLCVVEIVTADGLELAGYGTSPTWGSHGGPLTVAQTETGLTLQRWTEADGELTAADEAVALKLPENAFLGPIALDVATPSDGKCGEDIATVVAWTGADAATQGEIVTIVEDGDVSRQTTTGVFGLATVGGRVFYTGTSAVGGPTEETLALYAADARVACDAGLDHVVDLDTWGLASGPTAVDTDGNLFAILTDYIEGTQEIRGYAAASVATTTAAVAGEPVGTTDGFGDALAAIAPAGEDPGLVVMQANAGAQFAHGDVIGFTYTFDAGEITAGDEAVVLDLVAEDKNVVLFTDDAGRLWVGLSEGTGAAAVSTFYVLTHAD